MGLEKEGIEQSHETKNGEIIFYNVKELLNGVSTPNQRETERRNKDDKYLDRTYQDGLIEGKIQARKDTKEINDIVAPYSDENVSTITQSKEVSVNEKPSLIKTMTTFVVTFVVILGSIGLYDYLRTQHYLSDNGFYLALVFTVVITVVLATFALASMGIIPADKIPDILKPALGLINSNESTDKKDEIAKK